MNHDIPPDQTDDERRAAGLSPRPRPAGEPAPTFDVPTPVSVSFWLWIAAGVLFVLGYVIILLGKQVIIESVVKGNKDPKISADAIASGTTTLLWGLVLSSAVFAILFALFAYKAREGTRSARTILTVLLTITLVLEFLLQLFSAVTLFAMLIALIALSLMYFPSVRGHFPQVGRKLP